MSEEAQEAVQAGNQYVTTGVAAQFLHVSPKTINRWANAGLIPCVVTLGGHRRFRREDIEAVVRQMSSRSSDT